MIFAVFILPIAFLSVLVHDSLKFELFGVPIKEWLTSKGKQHNYVLLCRLQDKYLYKENVT